MAKVRADDNQRLGAAPNSIQNASHIFRGGPARHQRHQGELPQDYLQEWQLHLHGVFLRVGITVQRNLWQLCQPLDGLLIHRHPAQRSLERQVRGGGQAIHRHEMRRADHHDPVD